MKLKEVLREEAELVGYDAGLLEGAFREAETVVVPGKGDQVIFDQELTREEEWEIRRIFRRGGEGGLEVRKRLSGLN